VSFGLVDTQLEMTGRHQTALEAFDRVVEGPRQRGQTAALALAISGRASLRPRVGAVAGALADAEAGIEAEQRST